MSLSLGQNKGKKSIFLSLQKGKHDTVIKAIRVGVSGARSCPFSLVELKEDIQPLCTSVLTFVNLEELNSSHVGFIQQNSLATMQVFAAIEVQGVVAHTK